MTPHEVEEAVNQYLTNRGYGFQQLCDGSIFVQTAIGPVLLDCVQISHDLSQSSGSQTIASLVDARLADFANTNSLSADVDLVVEGDSITTHRQIATKPKEPERERKYKSTPRPPWWSVQHFTQEGFLLEAWAKNVREGKSLYFGRYGLDHFATISDFNYFAAKFGGCAQFWYATRDVAQLRSDMHPWPSETFPEDYSPSVEMNQSLYEILRNHDSSFLAEYIEDLQVLEFIVTGYDDNGEFLIDLVGSTGSSWIHIFYLDDVA